MTAGETKGQKMKTGGKKKILFLIGIPVLFLIVYLIFTAFFSSHFFFRTQVNGTDASASTPRKVMEEVRRKASDYRLTITDNDGNKTLILPKDVSLSVADSEKDFKEVLKKQDPFAWPVGVFRPKAYQSRVIVDIDDASLKGILSDLPAVKKADPVKTENAAAVFSDGSFSIKEEVYGDEVDEKALFRTVRKALTDMDPSVDLKKDSCYVQPTMKMNDETLGKTVEDLNKKIGISFTYDVGGAKEVVPKETLASFFSVDEKGKASYNEDAIRSFIKTMGQKYNTAGKPVSLKTSYGTTVSVPGGTYGYRISQDKELAQIESDLDAGKDVSRDFIYSQANGARNGGVGGTYVEVNLTGQHMFVYKNGAQVISTDVVTGNINKGNGTDVGAYYVFSHEKDRILNGETYHTHVNYWMPFHNGEGFHDAPWQPSFGGTYYKVRGSHGCVNLPGSVAKKLYQTISTGCPVFVYELPGTTNNAPNKKDAAGFDAAVRGIGTVTLSSEPYLKDLDRRWSKLTPEAKSMTTTKAALDQAKAALSALKAGGTAEGSGSSEGEVEA